MFDRDSVKVTTELNNVLETNKNEYVENTIENKDGLSKHDKAFNFNNRRIVMENSFFNTLDVYVNSILK